MSRRRPRRRWPWVAFALAVLLVAGGGGAVALLRTGGEGAHAIAERSTTLTAADEAKRDRAVAAVLKRRSRAVTARDRSAWLADVDRTDPRFVRAQRRVFDNLAQVDFASWSYDLAGSDFNRPQLAEEYRAQVYLPTLVLRYAIKGYDVSPVARPAVLTFVLRDGRWRIGGDSDADESLPEGGHAEPWDRRAIAVGEGTRALVLADAEDRAQLDELVRLADEAVDQAASVWPKGWRRKVVVFAVRDQRLVETYFRDPASSSENVAAIAVPVLDQVWGWADGPGKEPKHVSDRVILNPAYFDPEDEYNAFTLTHEVAHVAISRDTWGGAPTWLVEGAADYTADPDDDLSGLDVPLSLQRQVDRGAVSLPTYDFFARDVEANYLTGWLACRYIAEEYGEATLRRLYRRLGRVDREIYTVAEQDQAFADLLNTSVAAFEQDLATFIRRSLG